MAFNLTAELQLQANQNNINQVVGQIQNQLAPLGNVTVNVQTNTQAITQAANQVQRLDQGFRGSQKSASELNRTLVESARRFSVITVATGSLLSLVNAFKNSVKSALDFEVELAKIAQVTGKTARELGDLTGEVRKLATGLGVSNKDLLNTSRVLLQTGISANKTKQALDVLSKTTLAATFDNIQDTTEGAIALLNQFGAEAKRTGQDIAFLEQSLDAINAVSKKFAVESSDLIGVVRRVGGVFSAAGGDVNELIALFTSVRQTTRESAETISTGLRTIFTRLQRTDTVDALRDLNIELQDSKGQFVGAFEAVKRLSSGLSALDPKDFRFSAIVEELGGFRQVGKVIPLIKQFAVAQNALNVAQNASGSISRDAILAQKTLANRFAKTREKFDELISQFADSSSFRSLATGFLTIADSLIKIASALEPVLPLLTALFALKLGSGLASGIGLLRGFSGGGSGGPPVSRFAAGGSVPGSGSRDTVPAMLTPGEFVIRKSSVKKIGMNNLSQMNAKGYATGGKVGGFNASSGLIKNSKTTFDKSADAKFDTSINRFNKDDSFSFNRGIDKSINVNKLTKAQKELGATKAYKKAVLSGDNRARGDAFENIAKSVYKLDLSTATNARIDAVGRKNGELLEIKSERGSLSDKGLSEKAIGAAINPKDKVTDEKVAKVLTKKKLTRFPNDIDLPNVGVIQDVTNLSKINQKLKTKDGKDITQGAGFDKRQAQQKEQAKQAQKAALGGFIQKFAAGGAVQSVLDSNKVGAANLDVGKDKDVKLGVNLARVNATDPVQNNRFLKNFGGVAKYIESQGRTKLPSYTLKRRSLDKSTGDQFRTNIVSEVTSAADRAAGKVGQDLIGKSVKASEEAKQTLSKKLVKEGGVIGSVFEDVLNIVGNEGAFAPTNQFQPFDFPNGLSGPLADNFQGLPSSFVDARKRQVGKDKGSFETKIANQLALEAAASPFGKENIPAKGSKKAQKAQQVALGGMIKRLARGGSAGGDTVPAMLTPGEFVLNKTAAQNIGGAKLDALNKRGEVQGFAKGGAVGGVQMLAPGGNVNRPTGGSLGLSGQAVNPNAFGGIVASLGNVENAFATIGVGAEKFATIAVLVEQALANGATEAEAFNLGMDEVVRSSDEAKDAAAAAAAEQQALLNNPTAGNTVVSDENLASAQNLGGGGSQAAIVAAAGESEEVRQQLQDAQNAEIRAITQEIRQRDQNVGIQDAKRRAEQVVTNAYGVLARDIEVRKTLGQKLVQVVKDMYNATKARVKALKDSVKALYKEKGLKGVAGAAVGAVAGGVNKTASAAAQGLGGAQNLAFAGAAIGGVVASLGLFEEATNQAAAQAIAFGTTTIGLVATLAQTIAGFTASAAASTVSTGADLTEAVASEISGGADLAEASASGAAAGAIGIFTIGLVAAVAVLYFWSAQAKAQADKASKGFDAAFKDIEDGARGSASRLKNASAKEIRARAESAKFFSKTSLAIVGGAAAAGAIGGAAIGASLGAAFAPFTFGLSVLVGVGIGGAIGAFAALIGVSSRVETALTAEEKALIAEVDARNKAIDGLVLLTEAVAKSKEVFDQIENTIGLKDQKNEDGFNVATLRKQDETEKLVNLSTLDADGAQTQSNATKVLQELSDRTGQSVAELKGLNAEELSKAIRSGDTRNLADANKAVDQGGGQPELARRAKAASELANSDDSAIFSAAQDFKIALKTVEKRAEILESNLSNSGTQLTDLLASAPIDAAFEDLVAEGTVIGRAFKIRAAAIKASAEEQTRIDKDIIAGLEAKRESQGSLNNADKEALKGIKKQVEERKANTAKQIKEEEDFFEKQQTARQENAANIREEVAQRAAIVLALKEQQVALRDATKALTEAKNINSNIEFDTALSSDDAVPDFNKELDLESPIPEDVIASVQKFGKSIDNLTTAQQKQARAAIDQVTVSQKTAQQLSERLAGSDLTKLEGNPGKADEILKGLFPDGAGGSKITDDILLKAFNNVPEAVTLFKKDLEKAAEDGSLTSEEIDRLIAPIREAGGKAGETLKLFNDVINTELQRTNLLLKRENEARSKNLKAVNLYNDQILKSAEVILQAEGKDINASKGSRITAASQRVLDAGKAQRGGRALNAGDSQGLAIERKKAIAEKKRIDAEIKDLQRKQLDSQLNNDEVDSLARLTKARQVEINTIKDVTEAQKAQISSLDSQIAAVTTSLQKAAEAREQGFAVLEEFVLGGKDTRKKLNSGAAGISQALQTGTVQNQSEEQRANTIGLLDKLKDVQIGNTGLTGKEVKQELVFRDAIRLGFPPEVAQELATSTTIEEDMLSELKALVRIQNTIAADQMEATAAAAKRGLPPLTLATGGVVYKNEGGSIFQPKGTDTVPAMLTPGEFVIRKSAVDKVGVGALQSINQGQPLYRANGGPVYLSQGSDDKVEKKTIFGSLIGDESDRPLLQRILQPEKSQSLQKRLANVDSVIPGPKVGFQRGEGIAGVVGRGAGEGIETDDKINYADRILRNSGPKSQVSAFFQSEDISPFSNPIQSLAGLEDSIADGARQGDRSGFSALNNMILGQGFGNAGQAPKTDQEILSDGARAKDGLPSRTQFNEAFLVDSRNEKAFLEKELVTLQNAYKSESDYQGINFSKRSIPRSELVASGNDPQSALDKRYNDIRSSIEQKIKILTGAIRHDEERDDKEKRRKAERAAYDESASNLGFGDWKEAEQRKNRIKADAQNAGLSEEEVNKLSNSKNFYADSSNASVDYNYGKNSNKLNDSLAAEFVGSNWLWNAVSVDESGKPSRPVKGSNQSLNEGFTEAIKLAIANAIAKWNERSDYDVRQNAKYADKDGGIDEQPFWNNARLDYQYAAAKKEMYSIVSRKRSDPQGYAPKKYDEDSEIPQNKNNSLAKIAIAKRDAEKNKADQLAKQEAEEQRLRSLDAVNAPSDIDVQREEQIKANKKAQADYKEAEDIVSNQGSDLILQGPKGLQKYKDAEAVFVKGDPKDLPVTYSGIIRQEEAAKEEKRKAAQRLEEARNIASDAEAEAIAQGFSDKYAISAGFRAVDAAKIVKTPASGKNEAEYYGRNDVIGLVQKSGKAEQAARLNGFQTGQEDKAGTEGAAKAKAKRQKAKADGVLGGKVTAGLDASGQRRMSPQARRRQQGAGTGGGYSPIGQAVQRTKNFMEEAYQWGWADKDGEARKNYLFEKDAGYRSSFKSGGKYTQPEYYAYAAYAMSKFIKNRTAADNSPEVDKEAPTVTANQTQKVKAGKVATKQSQDQSSGGSGGYGGSGTTPSVTPSGTSSDPSLVLLPSVALDAQQKRFQDVIDDPTKSEGAKRSARRKLRDYNRKRATNLDTPEGRRDAQRERSQAVLNDPGSSPGAIRAAKQRLREADRKDNPLETPQQQRDAQRERFNQRIAEGGSEGKRIAAERGLRDLDRKDAERAKQAPAKAQADADAVYQQTLDASAAEAQRASDLGAIDSDLGSARSLPTPDQATAGDVLTGNLDLPQKAGANRPYTPEERKILRGPRTFNEALGKDNPDKRTGIGSNRVRKSQKYRANGGGVAGSDTIPAMLTPGEFVMSREAVQRNGVGYMRNLNKGVVKGFRRGGVVGKGNVRYRSDGSQQAESGGGGLSIDPSALQQVLSDFSASFKDSIDNTVAAFSSINTSLDRMANAINEGMTVTHQFSGDMKMAFKIEGGDALKNSIADALTPKISEIIVTEMDKRLGENGFRAGG